MSSPTISIPDVKVDSIHLYPGQTLTVWMRPIEGRDKMVQVELRVRLSGTLEIFSAEPVSYYSSFINWDVMEGENG